MLVEPWLIYKNLCDRKVSVIEIESGSLAIPTQVHLAAYYIMSNIHEIIFQTGNQLYIFTAIISL
jgi:hypothetical protein